MMMRRINTRMSVLRKVVAQSSSTSNDCTDVSKWLLMAMAMGGAQSYSECDYDPDCGVSFQTQDVITNWSSTHTFRYCCISFVFYVFILARIVQPEARFTN